jgi:hypothetical protein
MLFGKKKKPADLELGRLSWITSVGTKCHYKCPCKSSREIFHREGNMKKQQKEA